MSDKSFGDHTNRNIVKNPLLSSAVTGVSLEDLTHKAVLLPVTPSLGQITRSDQQGSQARTLTHPQHETTTFPSGDAFSNIALSNVPQIANQNLVDSKKSLVVGANRVKQTVTRHKIAPEYEDEFDVDEYFARLRSTRYVSAPLHSNLKEGQNANLEATEENLEEINLNESAPVETQQSLTADIAQNFSQLPAVLPHVASAVFSSFSNMLSYKSREQTPDPPRADQGIKSGYDEVQLQKSDAGVPLMGVEESKAPKEVAPPPKEPPIGTSSFRITSKKKYAQIPGLSSGDAAQSMTYPPAHIPPTGERMPPTSQNTTTFGQNVAPVGQFATSTGMGAPVGLNMPPVWPPVGHNMPPFGQNMPPYGQNMPPVGYNMPPVGHTVPPFGHNVPPFADNMPHFIEQTMPPVGHNIPLFTDPTMPPAFGQNTSHQSNVRPFAQHFLPGVQNAPPDSQSISNTGRNISSVDQSGPHFVQKTPSVGQNEPYFDSNKIEQLKISAEEVKIQESNVNTPAVEKPPMYNILNPATNNISDNKPAELVSENRPNLSTDSQNFFTPVENKEQNIPRNSGAAIIPPPPMFSNLPRKDSQPAVGKSILPPSVARRISANQPVNKPSASAFTQNIFVPSPLSETTECGQADSNISSGLSSAFVPAYNSSVKLEPIGLPSQSETNVPSSIPTPVGSTTSGTDFIPSNEDKMSTVAAPTFFTPEKTGETSTFDSMVTSELSPAMSTAAFSPDSLFGSPASNLPVSSFASMNKPPTSIFTPGKMDEKPENTAQTMFQSPPQNVPPTFFNPLQAESSSVNVPHPITQMPPGTVPEPKPVAEPPKPTGNVNFRMTKKRPQYYAGPIEGVGAISNNVKPVIAPAMPAEVSNFQGALFTPEQTLQPAVEQYSARSTEQASVPFDISMPAEQPSSHAAFNLSRPQEQAYGTSFNMGHTESQNYDQEYNTPFDMSRDLTEPYNQPKQESKGFGIIGSLKSKLSSIDINKIQSTVTTFFDPAYNDTKVAEPIIRQDNAPYQQQQFGQPSPGQSNFDVFVPSVEQNQYSQYPHSFDYSHSSQCQTQDQQRQNISSYSTSSYFTDPNYSTEQVHSNNPLYDNTQTSHPAAPSYNPQENIPAQKEVSNTDNTPYYERNACTKESMTKPQNKDHGNTVNTPNVNYFESNAALNLEKLTASYSQLQIDQTSSPSDSEESANMTYCNPNAFAQENRQIWEPQPTQGNFASFSQPFDQNPKNVSASALEKHEPTFYNPNAFSTEKQVIPTQDHFFDSNIQQRIGDQKDFTATEEVQIDAQTACDSALNTSKYKIASIQAHSAQQSIPTNVPILPASSFFDSPIHNFGKNPDVLARPEEDIKDTKFEKEKRLKEASLIESLSKNEIPVLGVSTAPLFGLSAIIPGKSVEVSDLEKPLLFETTYKSKKIFEGMTAASFFDNKEPENKIISENQVKKIPLDITALSIDDVKNVLVIEPPQENIGTLLKRNSSSGKLENLPEKRTKYFKLHNDDNESTTEIFFKHSDDNEKEVEEKDLQNVGNAAEEHSELNICETCREVNTPEHEQKHKEEDLTTQLIENITAIQLSHPLTIPLKESEALTVDNSSYDTQQLDEITHVAEETFEILKVQSATELLIDRTPSEVRDYGWITQETVSPIKSYVEIGHTNKAGFDILAKIHGYDHDLDGDASNVGQDYEFKLDANAIDFFSDNSLFSESLPVPTNASDEIKAEIKHSHEDIVLPRHMSIPTAPPEEEDSKLDEPGVLDVHSIEQDAKKDFPLEEEFIIEPTTDEFLSTDDDKLEFRERKRSSEDSTSIDTFTNRIERFKKKVDNPNDGAVEQKSYGSPPIPMASYFDTGNYAVESHFRNTLVAMGVPPGFEEEYARKLSAISISSADNTTEPYIPETSTQTRVKNSPTYSNPYDVKENIIGSEMRRKDNTEMLAQALVESIIEPTTTQAIANFALDAESAKIASAVVGTIIPSEKVSNNLQPLSDPMNFFSENVEEPKPAESAAPESFSRLASYFSMPPAQPEHSKSFFELSQSQNHYRHKPKTQNQQKPFFEISQSQNHYIDDDTKNNIRELMKDLTSPGNIQEQTVKTVNYFTVELDNNKHKNNINAAPINIKLDDINTNKNVNNDMKQKETKLVDNDSKDKTKDDDCDDIINCKYCRRHIPEVNTKVFIVKTAVNDTSEPSSEAEMPSQNEKNSEKKGNTNFVDFDVEKQAEESVTVINEHRPASEYSPVKHHWFYREDVEDKSVWRGFSNADSTALEAAHQSPDLDENTLVATDGGRYDVNVVGRLRIAVYWKEKPTNVRRCSWFYKGTTDARYVPYTEAVAEKLEEEYRHGVTTGEWHRRMVLPNSEMVIMHGPSVMVHFLHSGATDAFSTPPTLLGKRVYRSSPKIRVARDQEPKIDHLILLVHGAGEYKQMRYLDQAASRPRVVRRSHEESEIEESEPSKIDHLLLLCHGVGSACDMRFRSVEEVVEDFRATSLQLVQSHYRNSYDNGMVSRVEILPISWHEQLHAGEAGVDRRLARVTLDSIPRLRAFTNHTVLDVLFYTSPVFHQTIIDTVCSELNRVYSMFRDRNPHFKGAVSLGGHSLGSVILYDLLCHQSPESPLEMAQTPSEKRYVTGTAGTGQPVNYPQLVFPPAALYALGSPIAIFECIRGVETLGMEFALPTCKHFFNIFHPYDPIAYRIEPLINPQLQEVKPSQIPHHKGRKRMHLELKDTMVRVGADLKQKLIESLRTTWNKWKATPPPDGQLEKVVEEEMEKEQLTAEEEPAAEMQASKEMLGRLNDGRRVDYVLQEAPLEMINEYLFAMSSHVGYWESEDTMLLMLREIYDSLGVQPDSTVPQQNMTVQRTKTVPQDENSKSYEPDSPSTSRGGT